MNLTISAQASQLAENLGSVILSVGPFAFALAPVAVATNGRRQTMPDKEAALLAFLLTRVGEMVPYEDIMAAVWPGYHADISSHTLPTHINRLRARIAGVEGVRIISSEHRAGRGQKGSYGIFLGDNPTKNTADAPAYEEQAPP